MSDHGELKARGLWWDYRCQDCGGRITIATAAGMPSPLVCPDCGGHRWTVLPLPTSQAASRAVAQGDGDPGT